MKATVCLGFSSSAGATGGVYEIFAFAVVEVFRGFAVVHLPDGDVFFDSLPDVCVVGVLVLVFVDSDAVAENRFHNQKMCVYCRMHPCANFRCCFVLRRTSLWL